MIYWTEYPPHNVIYGLSCDIMADCDRGVSLETKEIVT